MTGNQGKLKEWRRMLPPEISVESIDIDLPEIQSTDTIKIATEKVKRAYELIGKPVIVDDVSAGLVKLKGLPGPFIKYFLDAIGQDALYKLAGKEGEKAILSCTIAYFDGQTLITAKGTTEGRVVAPRGENNFGFDKVVIPDGQLKTYGEMTPEEKDQVSHRSKAIKDLLSKIS